MDTHKRSIAKAISFRALVICSDSLIIFFITHRLDLTLDVIIFSNLASTLIYYLHERAWSGIFWGQK